MISRHEDTLLRSLRHNGIDLAAYVPPPWTADAVCAQVDPESFFPDKGGARVNSDAKLTCNGDGTDERPPCPVRSECLDYALENGEKWGIWGGKSERERRQVRRERGAA